MAAAPRRSGSAYDSTMSQHQRIPLYLSAEHPCGYLPERMSCNVYVDPGYPLSPARYWQLIEQGFRRSGNHVYRPYCSRCQKCLAARVNTNEFRPHRSQQRCLLRNHDLQQCITTRLTEEHYELFRLYICARHAGEGMDGDDRPSFHSFLECTWGAPEFWEFRKHGRLLCVAVVDPLPHALSAVYTFFDPAESARGLGTYAVLQQIAQARERGLPHVYLGYWVEGSRKMDYKRRFQPLEIFNGTHWSPLHPVVDARGVNPDNARPQ